MKPWTKEFELEYWKAHGQDVYEYSVKLKWSLFAVDYVLHMLNPEPKCAIDIGAGAYGGALRYLRYVDRKIMLDACSKEYVSMGNMPADVETYTYDFTSTVAHFEDVADVLFAWNVFDHANTLVDFIKGVKNCIAMLIGEGLFFGSFPMRKESCDGHPVTLSASQILHTLHLAGLKKFIRTFEVQEPHYKDNTLFIIGTK